MNHADPKFIKLIDIIQATPMARINREDARHIAERLVEAGVIREEVLDPSAEEIAKQIRVFANQDNLFMRTVEARTKEYIKPSLDEELPFNLTPVKPKEVLWDIDNNRPYDEWEAMLIEGRGFNWDVFRDSYPTSLQKAILTQGKSHPDHAEHEHTDCCK